MTGDNYSMGKNIRNAWLEEIENGRYANAIMLIAWSEEDLRYPSVKVKKSAKANILFKSKRTTSKQNIRLCQ